MKPMSVRGNRGFSLIEILVGVAIGLIGMSVMFRMVALWDTHTRTSTSGSDAQVAGSLAMFNLERDIRQAGMGFGLAKAPFMGCPVPAIDAVGPRPFQFFLYPVRIVPQAAGPDDIQVLYGNSSFFGDEQTFTASTATTKTLLRRGGFRPGDLAVVAGNEGAAPASAQCALVEVTADTNPDKQTIDHAQGTYTSFYGGASGVARYNTAPASAPVFSAGRIYNLGPSPRFNVWHIGAGSVLTYSDPIHDPDTTFEVAEGVVNMKAQYGVDSNADGRITSAAPDEWVTTTPVSWTQVLAVRVAILVRSKQFERTADPSAATPLAVTTDAPAWANGVPFVMTNADGTPDSFSGAPNTSNPNNWRFYRYRVYERVIPLRNMIWGTSP